MSESKRDDVWVLCLTLEGHWQVHGVFEDLADAFEEAHTDDTVRTWEVTVKYGRPAWLYAPPTENSGGWLITHSSVSPAGSAFRPPYEPDPEVDELEPPGAPRRQREP